MTEEEYQSCVDQSLGFCLQCGEEHSQIEPDAEGYDCQFYDCGCPEVMGIENLLVEGRLVIG
jgi:hypothetical protein